MFTPVNRGLLSCNEHANDVLLIISLKLPAYNLIGFLTSSKLIFGKSSVGKQLKLYIEFSVLNDTSLVSKFSIKISVFGNFFTISNNDYP